MKNRYKKEAYYLDEDILIHGYKDKMGFHPDARLCCGFGVQKLNRRDKNKVVFHKLSEAIKRLDKVYVVGGSIIVGVSNGLIETKLICKLNDIVIYHKVAGPVDNTNLQSVVIDTLKTENIVSVEGAIIKVAYFNNKQDNHKED